MLTGFWSPGGRLCHPTQSRIWPVERRSHAVVHGVVRGLRSVLRVMRSVARGRRWDGVACGQMTGFLLQLMETESPNFSRECHSVDPALHGRRLPLHSFGERGARPAGGVQFKVSVYSSPSLSREGPRLLRRINCAMEKSLNPVLVLFSRQSLLQILLIFSGVAVMALLSAIVDWTRRKYWLLGEVLQNILPPDTPASRKPHPGWLPVTPNQ